MRLKFLGGAREVTGSSFLLDFGYKILVDCGMRQKEEEKIFLKEEVDAVLLTHAHLDHSGLLPLLIKNNLLKGNVYSTPATKEVASLLLFDAAKIQREDEEKGKKALFDENDIVNLLKVWETYDLNKQFSLGNARVKFLDAGHIIGSSQILIEIEGIKILFTGDIGCGRSLLLNKPDVPKEHIDYLIIESTYGDREHPDKPPEEILYEEITSLGDYSRILIPAFAVGRAQEIIYGLKLKGLDIPVFLDSPLAEKVAETYDYFLPYLKPEIKNKWKKMGEMFSIPHLEYVRSNKRSKELAEDRKKKIVIAASGMLEGGRVMNHLPHILKDENAVLLFIGYQAEGTLGRKILEGERSVWIEDKEIEVKCSIKKIEGFSAHSDRRGLINFINNLPFYPSYIFIVHGEYETQKRFADELRIQKFYPYIPSKEEEIDLKGGAREKIIIDFEKKFQKYGMYEIMLFTGGILKDDNLIRVISKEDLFEIINEEEKRLKHKEKVEIPVDIEKEEIESITEEEFYRELKNMREEKILSKSKLQEFIENASPGIDNLFSWIRITKNKIRFYPDKEKNDMVAEILLRGINSLREIAVSIAEKVLEET
uniref:MBL fold metallo-hydrolase n=1 Tax=candidate division WOR-3 bacterium TaxID=2052148 RepID=A0A7C4UAT0_UNCW3